MAFILETADTAAQTWQVGNPISLITCTPEGQGAGSGLVLQLTNNSVTSRTSVGNRLQYNVAAWAEVSAQVGQTSLSLRALHSFSNCHSSFGPSQGAFAIEVLYQPAPAFASVTYTRGNTTASANSAIGLSLTVNGGEVITFHSPDGSVPTFYRHRVDSIVYSAWSSMALRIGNTLLEEQELTINATGRSLEFVAPKYEEMCGAQAVCTAEGGAYFPFTLVVHQTVDPNGGGTPQNATLTLSCPPDCPSGGRGLYYTQRCLGYDWGSACLKPNSGAVCAFGSGSSCVPCPDGAVCPGGFRAWPVAGYWTSTEGSGVVQECPPPALRRCMGWRPSLAAVECGAGYRQGSVGCSLCEAGYFQQDGACLQCPNADSKLQVAAVPFASFAGGCLLFIAVTFVSILVAVKRSPVTMPKPKTRALILSGRLTLWVALSLQLLTQVTRLPTPGLPRPLRDAISTLQLVQFEVEGILPPECTEGYPFLRHVLVFSALVACWVAMALSRCRCCSRVFGGIATFINYAALTAMVVGYTVGINTAVGTVTCLPGADGELLWASNPYYACFTGDHLPIAIYAFIIIALHGLGLPLLFLALGRRFARQFLSTKQGVTAVITKPQNTCCGPGRCCRKPCAPWARLPGNAFAAMLNTYPPWQALFEPGQVWLQPALLLLILWLAVSQAIASILVTFLARAVERAITVVVVVVVGSLLFHQRPDRNLERWRRLPRFVSNLVTSSIALLQLTLLLEDGNCVSSDEQVLRAEQQPACAGNGGFGFTRASSVMVWLVVLLSSALPFVYIGAYISFVAGLLGIGCRRCGRPHGKEGSAAASSTAATALRYMNGDWDAEDVAASSNNKVNPLQVHRGLKELELEEQKQPQPETTAPPTPLRARRASRKSRRYSHLRRSRRYSTSPREVGWSENPLLLLQRAGSGVESPGATQLPPPCIVPEPQAFDQVPLGMEEVPQGRRQQPLRLTGKGVQGRRRSSLKPAPLNISLKSRALQSTYARQYISAVAQTRKKKAKGRKHSLLRSPSGTFSPTSGP